ncbi:hypothetical protein PDJAM_G00170460 [Pangasius djambal]|uniref:Uncharacterized protein n=1 Tax=Pangasius djambal TaxID=1691987 RepID=A0ACC5ZMC4_9TELE|nr:hypothetical protein [Pangasius djambal]
MGNRRPAAQTGSDVYWEDQASQNALLLLEDHAHLTIGSETRERLLLLSTDSLIVAKTKSLYLKLKARVSLSDIWLASCIHRVTSRKFSTKTSFVIGWPTTNYVVTLSSSETKDKWLCALQWSLQCQRFVTVRGEAVTNFLQDRGVYASLRFPDHAHLTIGSETRERLLLLSTDSLIVAKTKSLYLKLKARVSLSDIWLASCIHRVTSRKFSTKTSFVIGWPTTNYVVTLSSSETKDKWLCALQW